jgi:threonyl-tRNA synthetase
MYKTFGFEKVHVELSTRPEKSIGSAEMWATAESGLAKALERAELPYTLNPGDGAFYGPKIDFHIRDVLKRSWQCGTIQLDFSMPSRFGLEYVGADGARHTPVMLHRACYGSIERFLGIIIENYAGAFPLWLSPVQVTVIPVSDKFNDYAKSISEQLLDAGLRVEVNLSPDRVGYKIRESSLQKVPYAIVVGDKEQAAGQINVRSRATGELGAMDLGAFLSGIVGEREPGGKPTLGANASAGTAREGKKKN